eukprot:gene13975-14090_t
MQRSRSSISVASIISVVASEPHEFYRRHIIVGIDNSTFREATAMVRDAFAPIVNNRR